MHIFYRPWSWNYKWYLLVCPHQRFLVVIIHEQSLEPMFSVCIVRAIIRLCHTSETESSECEYLLFWRILQCLAQWYSFMNNDFIIFISNHKPQACTNSFFCTGLIRPITIILLCLTFVQENQIRKSTLINYIHVNLISLKEYHIFF